MNEGGNSENSPSLREMSAQMVSRYVHKFFSASVCVFSDLSASLAISLFELDSWFFGCGGVVPWLCPML